MFSDLAINNAWASVGGIGGWNDADMLEVGNKGLTIAEQRTHFALCKRCFTTLLLLLLVNKRSQRWRLCSSSLLITVHYQHAAADRARVVGRRVHGEEPSADRL